MAALAGTNPTLTDLAKVTDPDGTQAAVVEILAENNEMLPDMSWSEGNLPTGHQFSVRTGLPSPTWRKLYGGVQPTKSTSTQVTATTGMLEAYSEVDVDLAKLNGNTAAFRLSEDKPHIEGMSQEIQDTLIFGNETAEPDTFTGLAPQFSDLSAASGDNIIDAGGTGSDNGSIWLVVWSEETVFGIVPKGSVTGLQVEDLGLVTLEDASGGSNTGRMRAYRSHYKWDAGLVVKDWRYVVRIANIDRSALSSVYDAGVFASPSANLPDLLFQAMELVPNMGAGRPAFYMDRTLRTMVRQQTSSAVQGSTLSVEDVGGKKVTSYHGVPLRRVDALSADESRVT